MPKRSITIFSFSDGHDSSAALIRDGRILAALQEERPKNIKHYDGIPVSSMKEVFRIAKVDPCEVDLVAISNLVRVHSPSFRKKSDSISKMSSEGWINSKLWLALHGFGYIPFVSSHSFAKLYVKILRNFREMKQVLEVLEDLKLADKETVFVEHHLSHAAAAYRLSEWSYTDPTLVFTADGAGDGISSTVSIGEGGELNRIAFSPSYDSLGNSFYGAVTGFLGFRPWWDEYKTMGLAGYGDSKFCIDSMRKIIRLKPKKPLEFENRISPFIQSKLRVLFNKQRFDNIAAAAQQHLEDLLVNWVSAAVNKFDIHKIACSGGVFLNVKANKRIREINGIEDYFFFPVSGDAGTAVGAGLQAYFKYCKREGLKPVKAPLEDLYLGPCFSDDFITQMLKKTGWISRANYYDSIDSVVGESLAKGKIIARFSDRLEFGPRALGNRSILADPRDLRVVRRINFAIKHRDFWMPFAPTLLEERAAEYLKESNVAPYMILAFDTTDKREDIIAGVHAFDLTCRPQTLSNNRNLGYRKVLEAFEDRTGVGGLLNTSFNLHGYPMVCNPKIALWTFENSQLDGLVLGKYFIEK